MNGKIAIVFDFDDTLAPDSTSGFLASIGIDPGPFWTQTVQQLLDEDWDPIPAYLWRMIEASQARPEGKRITRDRLREFGTTIRLFDGVEALFETLREEAKAVSGEADVEFYLISSGIGEILRATSVFPRFKDVWSCGFHYNGRGEIVYPKNVVSFTEKTKFMYKISKGLVGPASRGRPFEVNERIPREQYRIPFSRMIVIGDGHTDIPMFALVNQHEGYSFGVYDPDRPGRWAKAFKFIKHQRVASLYTAKYGKGADLHNALVMAVRDLAERVGEDRHARRR